MKHLYPKSVRSLTSVKKIFVLSFLLACNAAALSQNLSFTSFAVESGTNKLAGCVYRFPSVATSADALVRIDSLVGVSMVSIDSTPSGSNAALQPMISSPGGTGLHYAVLTISFVSTGTSSHRNCQCQLAVPEPNTHCCCYTNRQSYKRNSHQLR